MKGDDIQTSMAELRKLCVLAGYKQEDIKNEDVTIAMQQVLTDFKVEKPVAQKDENLSEVDSIDDRPIKSSIPKSRDA